MMKERGLKLGVPDPARDDCKYSSERPRWRQRDEECGQRQDEH